VEEQGNATKEQAVGGMTQAEIAKQEEKRKAAYWQSREKRELEKRGLKWPLPKVYSTVYVFDMMTRQKSHRLAWNLTGKQETLTIRSKGMAKASFAVAIRVLKSLGYKEDLEVKEEKTPTGWYFDLGANRQ